MANLAQSLARLAAKEDTYVSDLASENDHNKMQAETGIRWMQLCNIIAKLQSPMGMVDQERSL